MRPGVAFAAGVVLVAGIVMWLVFAFSGFSLAVAPREPMAGDAGLAVKYSLAYSAWSIGTSTGSPDPGATQKALRAGAALRDSIDPEHPAAADVRALLDAQQDMLRWDLEHAVFFSDLMDSYLDWKFIGDDGVLLQRAAVALESLQRIDQVLVQGAVDHPLANAQVAGAPTWQRSHEALALNWYFAGAVLAQVQSVHDPMAPFVAAGPGPWKTLVEAEASLGGLPIDGADGAPPVPTGALLALGQGSAEDAVAAWLSTGLALGRSEPAVDYFLVGENLLVCGRLGSEQFCPRGAASGLAFFSLQPGGSDLGAAPYVTEQDDGAVAVRNRAGHSISGVSVQILSPRGAVVANASMSLLMRESTTVASLAYQGVYEGPALLVVQAASGQQWRGLILVDAGSGTIA